MVNVMSGVRTTSLTFILREHLYVHQMRVPHVRLGFQHINERGEWSIKAGGKYFFTRNFR